MCVSLRIYICYASSSHIYICTHTYIHDLMNSHKLNALPFDLLITVLSHHLLPELNVISSERPPLTSQCRVSFSIIVFLEVWSGDSKSPWAICKGSMKSSCFHNNIVILCLFILIFL